MSEDWDSDHMQLLGQLQTAAELHRQTKTRLADMERENTKLRAVLDYLRQRIDADDGPTIDLPEVARQCHIALTIKGGA